MSDCLNPVDCWLCGKTYCKADGLLSPRLVFSPKEALSYYRHIYGDGPIALAAMNDARMSQPCGKCKACMIRKRKEMSVRLAHECSMYENAVFLTLTYDEDFVPVTDRSIPLGNPLKDYYRGRDVDLADSNIVRSLSVPDLQKFMKRVRRHLEYQPVRRHNVVRDHLTSKIRYFACGEYGSKTLRPHYHVIIFGWKPSDLEPLKMHNGNVVYVSKQIQKLWPFGHITCSDVNTSVAQYCARYVTKKLSTMSLRDYVIPEFTLSSKRNGGIGATWWRAFGRNACKSNVCTIRSRNGDVVRVCLPKYYIYLLRKYDKVLFQAVREKRMQIVKNSTRQPRSYCDILRAIQVIDYHDHQLQNYEVF